MRYAPDPGTWVQAGGPGRAPGHNELAKVVKREGTSFLDAKLTIVNMHGEVRRVSPDYIEPSNEAGNW